MTILRILLVVALIGGCAYVAMRAPWLAKLTNTAPLVIQSDLGDAPLWDPPETPGAEVFPKHLVPQTGLLEGTEIVVIVNRRKMFGLSAVVVVGSFFLFGVIGTIIQRRPETTDVAFSLWLSLGMTAGVVVSAILGTAMKKGPFPFFSECFLAGFIAGLLIAFRSQSRLPLPKESRKK